MMNALQKYGSKSDRGRVRVFVALLFVIVTVLLPYSAHAQSRRIKVGQVIPEFSVKTVEGKVFEYKHSDEKILLICFLSAGQKRSKGAAEDITRLTRSLQCKPDQVDLLVVVEKPEAQKLITPSEDTAKIVPKIVVDKDYKLWGKFGIIALPTIIIGSSDNKVALAAPGYSYDFYGQIEGKMKFLLGLGPDISQDQIEVKTIKNNSLKNKVARNIQMATVLKEKGRYDAALMIAQRAVVLDPNSVEVKLFLGELNCLADKPDAALQTVEGILKPDTDRPVRAKVMLIKGWALRRKKNNTEALNCLTEAVKLDPLSVRNYYELGNLYTQTGQTEKAAQAYRAALKLVIDEEK